MKTYIYITLSAIILIFTECKRKTDISITLYNPFLDEYVSNATIAIIERKGNAGGGLFSSTASCIEIATAETDINGVAIFNDTKLKRREGFVYYPVIKSAWGIINNYPCGGYNGSFLTKGGSNIITKSDRTDGGTVKLQFNNLFNPGMLGDSIFVNATRITSYDPELNHDIGGGGVSAVFIYDVNQLPYSNTILGQETKINGKFIVSVYKKKMGIVSITTDTIKAYPNQNTVIQINW